MNILRNGLLRVAATQRLRAILLLSDQRASATPSMILLRQLEWYQALEFSNWDCDDVKRAYKREIEDSLCGASPVPGPVCLPVRCLTSLFQPVCHRGQICSPVRCQPGPASAVSARVRVVQSARQPGPVCEQARSSPRASPIQSASKPDPVREPARSSLRASPIQSASQPDPAREPARSSLRASPIQSASQPDPVCEPARSSLRASPFQPTSQPGPVYVPVCVPARSGPRAICFGLQLTSYERPTETCAVPPRSTTSAERPGVVRGQPSLPFSVMPASTYLRCTETSSLPARCPVCTPKRCQPGL